MRFLPSMMGGIGTFAVVLSLATVCNAYNSVKPQALILKPSHHHHVRAASNAAQDGKGDGYNLPPDYGFDMLSTSTEPPYSVPDTTASTSTFSAGYSSMSSQPVVASTTKPRSSLDSDGPETESTSTVTVVETSGGAFTSTVVSLATPSLFNTTSPFSASSLYDSTKNPMSQASTISATEKTVTVTVTDYISSALLSTAVSFSDPVSITVSPMFNSSLNSTFTQPIPVASSKTQEASISVMTIISLSTITFSKNNSATFTRESSLLSTPEVTSTPVPTQETESQHATSPANEVSIVTVTSTTTITASKDATALVGETTSMETTPSAVDAPNQISHTFPTPISLSSSTTPIVSSIVSGVVTSLSSSSFAVTASSASNSVNVTWSIPPGTVSRGSAFTYTQSPTYPTAANTTNTAVVTMSITTLYSPSASNEGDSNSASMSNATDDRDQTVSTSTQVIIITVYPTPLKTTNSSDGTSDMATRTIGSTVTMMSPPYSGNSTSMALGTATGWPKQVNTTCLHGSSRDAATNTGSVYVSSAPTSASGIDETLSYSLPTTFKTTVSPSSSGNPTYPSLPAEAPPHSQTHPWGGNGPLHRLQGLYAF